MLILKRQPLILLTFLFAFLTACAQLGLPTPQTMNEKIAAAQSSVTQIRVSATQLLDAKKMTSADAENIMAQTDNAAKGIEVARTMSANDPNAANAKLTAVVTVLTAVQAYLAGKSK